MITDWMSPAGRDRAGIEVPDPVAEDLRRRGYVQASSSGTGDARTATFVALTVRHRGGSSVVFLVQVPGVVRALALALVTWFNGSATDDRLELVAHRPDGVGRFRSDSAPSVDRVVSFLRESIWGEDSPPDGSPSGSAARVSGR